MPADSRLEKFEIVVEFIGHPQTCVYAHVCLQIDNVSGKAPFLGQGVW